MEHQCPTTSFKDAVERHAIVRVVDNSDITGKRTLGYQVGDDRILYCPFCGERL